MIHANLALLFVGIETVYILYSYFLMYCAILTLFYIPTHSLPHAANFVVVVPSGAAPGIIMLKNAQWPGMHVAIGKGGNFSIVSQSFNTSCCVCIRDTVIDMQYSSIIV